MKKQWLNKQNNDKCILFFNEWAMDETIISHLNFDEFDICMFNNYNSISSIEDDFSQYSEIYVVAWSLGVWVASKVLANSNIKFTKTIAINGTQQPIDDKFGINPSIFQNTLEEWNEKNRKTFYLQMFGDNKKYRLMSAGINKNKAIYQKNELRNLQIKISLKESFRLKFNTALIGSNDLFFTPQNQFNYWKRKTKIVISEFDHYPFTSFEGWKQIAQL